MSSIYNSDRKIEHFFLGSQEITEMFLGNELVFSKITNNLFYKLHEFVGSLTVQNTIEAPVKSAILKGNTLVNLVTQKSGRFNGTRFLRIPLSHTLKTNTKYFVKFNLRESSLTDGVTCRLRVGTSASVVGSLNSEGIITVTKDGCDSIEFYITNANDVTNGLDAVVDDIMLIEYQNGMENWDIPYFEAMQSVKMPVLRTTGKNLFNINIFKNESDEFEFPYEKWKMQLRPNTTYIANSSFTRPNNDKTNYDSYGAILNGSEQIEQLYLYHWNLNLSFVNKIFTTDDTGVIYLGVYKGDCPYNVWDMVEMQIEEGSTATSYEPYKSNILTVNEDVELRGIGEVKDELDLLTGELTQRIGEVVLDGSEDWQIDSDTNDYRLALALKHNGEMLKYTQSICDRYPTKTGKQSDTTYNYVYIGSTSINLYENPSMTLEEFKSKLKQNPMTFQYQFTTESIKTVDLTIVDQDGKTINKLKSFNGTTHVSTEVAENSTYPMVSLEVATELQATVKID